MPNPPESAPDNDVCRFFFQLRGRKMGSNQSGIHHDGIDVVRIHDGFENLVPNPGFGPAIEAVIDR